MRMCFMRVVDLLPSMQQTTMNQHMHLMVHPKEPLTAGHFAMHIGWFRPSHAFLSNSSKMQELMEAPVLLLLWGVRSSCLLEFAARGLLLLAQGMRR